jgi:malonyl-CoA O-methyltransferase
MPPRPTTQDPPPVLAPRAAYALWAASYPAQAHNPLMLAEERAMLALLPANLGGLRVLDAGCGSGRYLRHAAQRGAAQLVGVDLSREMLLRAAGVGCWVLGAGTATNAAPQHTTPITQHLIEASLDHLPLADGWADLTICGLTIGHLEDLRGPLAELRRATRAGGTILISDFHPIGAALGWRREFRAGGARYAVRHTAHSLASWRQACADLGLEMISISEPQLDPADIPPGASFDPAALSVPVALVLKLLKKN